MKKLLIIGLALASMLACSVVPVDYSITKLIEVDSASTGPFLGSLKWSPDGTKLAFFKGKDLMLTDTLGNTAMVKKIDSPVHRYEWTTNGQLALYYRTQKGPKVFGQLVTVDIDNRRETIIAEYKTTIGFFGGNQFRGPFISHKGRAFFDMEGYTDKVVGSLTIGRHFFATTKSPQTISEDFIVTRGRWGKIYKKFLDGRDSLFLCDKIGWEGARVVMSADERFLIMGQHLLEFSTGKTLDIMIFSDLTPPEGQACGLSVRSLNPKYPEAIFHESCDDGHYTSIERAGIFNYETKDFLVLDTLVGLNTCTTPVFHPEGNIMAFRSGGKLYLAGLGRGAK